MRAGELRHQISIQNGTKTQDNYGEESVSWSTLATVMAAIWPLKGKEYFSAQQVQSSVTHKVRTRYISGVTVESRILYGTRVFHIRSVINPDERNIMLEMMCEEGS